MFFSKSWVHLRGLFRQVFFLPLNTLSALGVGSGICLFAAPVVDHPGAALADAARVFGFIFLALSVAYGVSLQSKRAELGKLRRANKRLRGRIHFLHGQVRVLRAVSKRRPLNESLGILCSFVEARIPGARCSALLLDSTGQQVNDSVAPSLPQPYNQALIGLEIGPTVGSCGAAMSLKRPVMIDDVQAHPNWEPFRALVGTTGMRACWSSPVLGDDDQVLGAFAVYHEQPRMPSRSERLIIHMATEMARIAVGLALAYRQLALQSLRDDLTGLANRRGVKKWLAQRLDDSAGVGVLLLDLDDFKPVNDTFGHAAGDRVLRVVAGRLRDLVDESGIVCRLGGDEFTIGTTDADDAMLERLALQIIDRIGQPIAIDRGHSVSVRCSLGIARHPADGETIETLLIHADQAMYLSKKSGKNQYRFWDRKIATEAAQGDVHVLSPGAHRHQAGGM